MPTGAVSSRPVAVVTALSLATFVTALDNTVVNVALPRIQRDLGLGTAGLEWVVTGYVLTFASLMFLGGRLADRHGRRVTFVLGLVIFALASAAAAASVDAGMLIAARAVQGVGGALLLPASLSILGADVSPQARQFGAGVATAAAAGALALGPLLGGAISEHWRWNGIFLINLPIVAACLALTWWGVPAAPATGRRRTLGLPGIISAGVAVSALVWWLIEAGPHGWFSARGTAAAGICLAALAVFVGLARAGRATIVDGPLLRNRVFGGAVIASVLWGLGVNGVFFFTSLFLQNVLRQSPVDTGLTFVPLALALVATVIGIGAVVRAAGARVTVASGLVLVAGGLVWVSSAGAGVLDLVPALVLIGAGSGLTVPLTSLALGAVDDTRLGMASSLITAGREVAGAFGVAGIGAVVAARSGVLRGGGTDPRLAFLGGYQLGLQVAAAVTTAGAVIAFVMLRPAPDASPADPDVGLGPVGLAPGALAPGALGPGGGGRPGEPAAAEVVRTPAVP